MCLRSDKDDAGCQLDPTKIPSGATIQSSGDAAELGEKGMPTLDRTADAADPRRSAPTAFGRLHPKARRVGAGIGRAVALGSIGTGTRQIAHVGVGYRGFGRRRRHDHRLEHRLRLHAIVGTGRGHDGTQRQAVFLGR
jgi:hypothetical protein